MKKVIFEELTGTINVNLISNGMNIGYKSEGIKGFIAWVPTDKFVAMNGDCYANGNTVLHQTQAKSKNESVKILKEYHPESDIYVFETSKSLFKWLSE